MAKKLKCWKKVKLQPKDTKIGTIAYSNKKKNDNIIVYNVKRAGWFIDRSNPSIGITLKVKDSKTQAIKFAKEYMKKHDKC